MARGLYRVYLYTVTILLAVLVAGGLAYLLSELFRLTSMRGQYTSPPSSSDITQSVVFFVVALIVGGGFGALHYWLIRRDSAHDPSANESGVRAFLLNYAEAQAFLVAIFTGSLAVGQIGASYPNDITYQSAIAISALLLGLAFGFERRRLTPTRGAALIFVRLRRHLLPLYLLPYALFYFYMAASPTENYLLRPYQSQSYCYIFCSEPTWGTYLSALIQVGAWLLFLVLASRDATSLIRQVTLFIGWASGGMILFTIAFGWGANYVLQLVTPGVPHPSYFDSFNFAPLMLTGVVALAVYGWMLRERADPAMNTPLVAMTMRAIACIILAVPFYIGVGLVIYNLFESATGASTVTATSWDNTFAYIIAGVAYIPLSLWLGASTSATGIKGPRRGMVLAMLAGGALVTAGGAAWLLYAVITPALGAPLNNWQETARGAGATLITGLILGGLYLFIALREQQFIPAVKAPEAPATPVAPAATLDEVLAQLQAGAISQEAAAERIRELSK